eukprot:9420626-Alexandrium_andersonii.AAC.1
MTTLLYLLCLKGGRSSTSVAREPNYGAVLVGKPSVECSEGPPRRGSGLIPRVHLCDRRAPR